jgi:hypothetical protein
MVDSLFTLLGPLLPILLSALAPVITAGVKQAVGDKLPSSVKPVINALAGAALAGVSGGDPTTGVVGAMVGNRVREALKS